MILPFEGQRATDNNGAQNNGARVKPQPKQKANGGFNQAARKQFNQPTGKLSTTNIGIKSTLNPVKKKNGQGADQVNPDLADDFTFDQLEYVWKEYSLSVKREKKDSLYSTLTNSKMTMSSDYQVHLEIINAVQVAELEKEKVSLLGFLRSKLRNYNIGLNYTLKEQKQTQVLDNKGVFEKLAEENTSLVKFRKLFNLDIEF